MLTFKKVLVPIDFSDPSKRLAQVALELASGQDAEVQLLYVWEPPHYVAPDVMLAMPGYNVASIESVARKEAEKSLAELAGGLPRAGARVASRVETGRPSATILRVAHEGFDLIVMGTHGHTGLEKLLLGSVAQVVVARAPCPVLTLRSER